MMNGLLFRLVLRSTGDRFSLFQKSGHAVGLPFVRVLAEHMAQFVADSEIQKTVSANMPYIDKFRNAPGWSGN
jgi:hypothetical protein